MRHRLLFCLAVSLTLGCQLPTGKTALKGGKPKPKASAAIKVEAKDGRLPLAEARRVVDPTDLTAKTKFAVAALVGKAKLISDHGGGIISNNGGTLISDKGGSLIGNNSAGIIGQNGAGVVGQNGASYAVLQTGGRQESLLADAEIELLDAAGRVLVGKDGKPLGGVTDKDGGFKLEAALPDENLVLRIRLHPSLSATGAGGQLFATLPRERRSGELDLDTASSIGTRYVLDQFVKGEQKVFDRLPASEAEALDREIEAARGLLGDRKPSYKPADLVAVAEELRGKDKTVGQRLETIKAILLAGQADLGTGLPATRVALALPTGVVGDRLGNLFVAEVAAFRIRKIGPDGLISVFAGTGARDGSGGIQGQTLEAVSGMAIGPDGFLYVTQTLTNQIRKIAPDGTMSSVLDLVGGAAGGLKYPGAIAVAPDGTIYVGEVPNTGGHDGRLLAIKDGVLTDISPVVDIGDSRPAWPGVGLGADGTLYAAQYKGNGAVYRRRPGAAWEKLAAVPGLNSLSRLWVEADGAVIVSAAREHKVVRVAADGSLTTVAGTGEQGLEGDGGPATKARVGQPAGLWRSPAGELHIADADGLVRKITTDGTIMAIAGTTGLIEGDALGLSVNGPSGLAIDREGKLLFSESGGSTIKRLDGRNIALVAGAGAGYDGDGGPATSARFANPAGIAFAPDGSLWVIDALNRAIRKIDPAGTVTTVVRDGGKALNKSPGPYPVGLAPMFEPFFCTVSPKGLLYWTDAKAHQVFRLREDGTAEVVIGKYDKPGDPATDKPASECEMHTPLMVLFDARGDLLVLATGNSRVLRIAQGEPASRVETIVGLTPEKFFGSYFGAATSPDPAAEEGKPAVDAMLLGASAMCLDPAGNLYIAELGTAKLATFGEASLGGTVLPAEIIQSLPQVSTRVRRVSPDGTIRTIAGDGTRVLNDPASDNILMYPLNMVVDREGRLIIADSALNQIKMLPKGSF